MKKSEGSGDEVLSSLWSHAELNWDNPAAHKALLQQCNTPAQLAELAKRYREAAEEEERVAIAKKQLSAVAMVAMAQLEVRPDRQPTHERRRYLLIAFFLISSVLLYWFL